MAEVFEAVIRVWEKYPFLTHEEVQTVVAAVARVLEVDGSAANE